MIASIKTSAALLLASILLGFAYSILSFALCEIPNIDVLDAVGLVFALGLGAIMLVSAVCLVIAVLAFAMAPVLFLASLLCGLFAPACTKPFKRLSERALIDRLYPCPDPFRHRIHA